MNASVLNKYACLLLDYCLEVKSGQKLFVRTTTLAEPLVREVYRESIKRGAHIEIDMSFSGKAKIYYDFAEAHQIAFISPVEQMIFETFDAYLVIRAPFNLREDQQIDPVKQRQRGETMQAINELYSERTADGSMRRCLCQYPTEASAQEAGMSLEEYADFVYSACKLDQENAMEAWKQLGREQQKIADFLNKTDHVRYVNEQTDISFSVKGRNWINSDGKANMPSGEVFSAPIEDSVEGTVYFDYPSIYRGKEARGIRLEVSKGKIVKWTAELGQDLLDQIFAAPGADYFGEVAIGTNYGVTKATKNILFDEKIGGTVHMAVGQSYLQCGGKNKSQIHWDMIADMTQSGRIYADGKLIYENGYFLEDLKMHTHQK